MLWLVAGVGPISSLTPLAIPPADAGVVSLETAGVPREVPVQVPVTMTVLGVLSVSGPSG